MHRLMRAGPFSSALCACIGWHSDEKVVEAPFTEGESSVTELSQLYVVGFSNAAPICTCSYASNHITKGVEMEDAKTGRMECPMIAWIRGGDTVRDGLAWVANVERKLYARKILALP